METRIETVPLAELNPDPAYNLSFPVKTDRFRRFADRFPGFPGIIVNRARSIVFGIDAYHYHRSQNHSPVTVLSADLSPREGLFLNFNLKEKLFGLNLYETLVFLKKALPLAGPDEIREKTEIRVPVNRELAENLDLLTGPEFKQILMGDQIHLDTAMRLCSFEKKDRQALISLLSRFHFSRSQQHQALDWIEELMFRDKTPAAAVLSKLKLHSPDPARTPREIIMEQLAALRHPEWRRARDRWRREIQKLDLPPDTRIHHSPFFEKGEIRLTMILRDWKNLEDLIQKIKK